MATALEEIRYTGPLDEVTLPGGHVCTRGKWIEIATELAKKIIDVDQHPEFERKPKGKSSSEDKE